MGRNVLVIAGIGPGLSEEVAKRFHKAGHHLALIARSDEFGPHLAKRLNKVSHHKVYFYQADLTKENQVKEVFKKIKRDLGPPDHLLYTAGFINHTKVKNETAENFKKSWETNCFGAFLCIKEIIPHLLKKQHGNIGLIGATASIVGNNGFSSLASSKFALRGLAESLFKELSPLGIHVFHLIVDGVILMPRTLEQKEVTETNTLPPAIIAEAIEFFFQKLEDAWSFEVDLRHHKGVGKDFALL